jgi:hypothetical protein
MGDWTVYDGDTVIQADLTEQAARELTEWHRSHDETSVYALGPDDQRFPPAQP